MTDLSPPLRLALFDLDHTLLPFDSGMRWARFLVEQGAIEARFEHDYLAACQAYVGGRINALALHQVAASAFADRAVDAVAALADTFGAQMAAHVPAEAHALVARHRDEGAQCCIVSATNGVVVDQFARLLGVSEVCATALEVVDGRYSGRLDGPICHGAEKVVRVAAWLHSLGRDWAEVAHSVFYSDACSDRPLFERCDEAVAVTPDAALRAHAIAAGWRIADTLAAA